MPASVVTQNHPDILSIQPSRYTKRTAFKQPSFWKMARVSRWLGEKSARAYLGVVCDLRVTAPSNLARSCDDTKIRNIDLDAAPWLVNAHPGLGIERHTWFPWSTPQVACLDLRLVHKTREVDGFRDHTTKEKG